MNEKITSIVVQNGKIIIHRKTTIELNLTDTSEDRYKWLKDLGYTKVFPTWSGYGFAFNRNFELWFRVDLKEKKIIGQIYANDYRKPLKHIPKHILREKAVNPDYDNAFSTSIPVIIKQKGL